MKNTAVINVLSKDTIVLPFSYANIKQTQRKGDNLIITLNNGNTIELEGFFTSQHNLLLKAENGAGFEQLIVNQAGTVEQATRLSSAEVEALLGSDALSALAKQSTDAVLLNAAPATQSGSAIADSTPLYIGIASLGILGTMAALSGKTSSNTQASTTQTTTITRHPDGSTTTVVGKDTDNDGKIDTTVTTEKDKDGNTTKETTTVDKNEDGVPEETTTVTKNPDGSTTTVVGKDTDNDGKIDTTVTTEKDKDGNTTKETTTVDKNEDGVPEETTTVTKNLDGSTTTVVGKDTDNDGKIDTTTTTTTDAAGTVTKTVAKDMDENGTPETSTTTVTKADGTPVSETTTTTQPDGSKEVVAKEDTDNDGKFDTTTTTTTDAAGTVTKTVAKDMDENGTPETSTTTVTKADGTPVSETTETTRPDGTKEVVAKEDTDNDGKFDTTTTTLKDAEGKVTTETVEKDLNENGKPEEKIITTFNPDGSKTVITEKDTNENGKFDSKTRATYDNANDEHPSLVEHLDVNNNDSVIQRDFDTDKNGVFERSEYDANSDGNNELVETRDNTTGVVTKREVDADDNGRIERVDWNRNQDTGNHFEEKVHYDNDLSVPANTLVKTEYDNNPEDGVVDKIVFPGNAAGVLVKQILDTNQDGKLDTVLYNPDGDAYIDRKDTLGNSQNETDVVKSELDINDDGKVDKVITYEGNKAFDTNGDGVAETYKPAKASFNDNNDGNIDRIETYQYDNKGNVTEVKYFNDGNDTNDNGAADRIEINEYNDKGQLVKQYINTDGQNNTGTTQTANGKSVNGIDEIITNTYNAEGLVARKDYDGNADGNVDRSESYTYDKSGNIIRVEYNDDNKGEIERVQTNKYDANGNLVESRFYNDGDEANDGGKADSIEKYRYNTLGQRIGKDVDSNGDGIIDSIQDYQLDSKGNIIKTTYSVPVGATNDGKYTGKTPTGEDYFVLDSNSNVVKKYTNADAKETTGNTLDIEGFGSVKGIDSIQTYTNNAKGQTIKTEYDHNADQTTDSVDYFERNANGSITKKYVNLDNNTSTGSQQAVAGQGNIQGIDRIETYTLNAKSEWLKAEYDFNADNKADKINYWEVNATGLATKLYTNNDANATVQTGKSVVINGETVNGIDSSETRYFDENNRTYKVEYSNDASGKVNKVDYFIYDNNGNITDKLINRDGLDTTGETKTILVNGVPTEVKGIDTTEHYTNNAKGSSLVVEYNNDADGATTSDGGDGVKDVITYIVRDANGNWIGRYFNKDGKDSGEEITVEIDGKLTTLKGIDAFERYTTDAFGRIIQTDKNFDAKGDVEEITYTARDETGRTIGQYTDIDNSKTTGTGNDGIEKITLADGRVLTGVDKYETYVLNTNGQTIQVDYNHDAKGLSEEIRYVDIDTATGTTKGTYYNLDADQKDGTALQSPTGETITLSDGRQVVGVDKYITYERDSNNFVIQENHNLDAKGDIDRVIYLTRDAYGNQTGRYDNLDNDTTLVNGQKTVTGQTIDLGDGRTVNGIERFYLYERDANGNLIKETQNLDAKDNADMLIYNVFDEQGRVMATYQNSDNQAGTGYQHTINGQVVEGIDRITRYTRNADGAVEKTEINPTGENSEAAFTNVITYGLNNRNSIISYLETVQTESGVEQKSRYINERDIYDRTVQRLWDNDLTIGDENGFDKKNTYTYDVYGNLIRINTDENITDDIPLNGYTTYERDMFGNNIVSRDYNSEGILTLKRIHEYNQYNYLSKLSYFNSEDGNPRYISTRETNERGYLIHDMQDKNGNGIFDSGDLDMKLIKDFNDNILARYDSFSNGNTIKIMYQYDDFKRTKYTYRDKNDNNAQDPDEDFTLYSYHGTTDLLKETQFFVNNEISSKNYFVPDGSGSRVAMVFTQKVDQDVQYKSIEYGLYGLFKNSVDDYTSDARWLNTMKDIGSTIERIKLATKANTDLTLDNDVIAKLAKDNGKHSLTINGDNSDTVRLKDFSEFKQIEDSGNYHKFTTQVDGQNYTLYVYKDVNLFDADSNTVIGG